MAQSPKEPAGPTIARPMTSAGRVEPKSKWLVPIITAIATVVGSIAVAYIGYMQATAGAAKTTERTLGGANLPVGTIISSMLPPGKFQLLTDNDAVFNATRTSWVLADGTTDITGSRYEIAMRHITPPDLRGMFLRGINGTRNDGKQDPDGPRVAGVAQADQVGPHTHPVTPRLGALGNPLNFGGNNEHGVGSSHGTGTEVIAGAQAGATETRPRNVAVYWYMRIN